MISWLIAVFALPIVGLALWARAIARKRGTRWFWVLWIPFALACMAGTSWWLRMAQRYLHSSQRGWDTGEMPDGWYLTFAIIGLPFPIAFLGALFLLTTSPEPAAGPTENE